MKKMKKVNRHLEIGMNTMIRNISKARNKTYNVKKRVDYILEIVLDAGFKSFCLIGFIYGFFALSYVFKNEGIKMPSFFVYSFDVFCFWLAISVVLYFISCILFIIYFNKKNWKREK